MRLVKVTHILDKKYNKSVLVVEDEEDILELIVVNIEDYGDLNVVGADNVKSAIAKLKNHKFDCIIIDLRLKDGSGEKIINFVRKNIIGLNVNTPIIISSGVIDGPTAKRVRGMVNDALVKPYDYTILTEKVRKLVNNNQKKDFLKQQIKISERSNILIVDDEKDFVELLSEIVSQEGINPISSYSISDAIQKLARQKFDCILLDRHFPQMNGENLVINLRNDPKNENFETPIIILTSDLDEDFMNFLKGGVQGFLQKPVKDEDFLQCLHKVMSTKKSK